MEHPDYRSKIEEEMAEDYKKEHGHYPVYKSDTSEIYEEMTGLKYDMSNEEIYGEEITNDNQE